MNNARRQPEPQRTMLQRLRAEAQAGRPCRVKLNEALEFRRNQYGLTRSEFAALLGLSLLHYSEVMNRLRDLPKRAMRRAYAIGVPAAALLQPMEVSRDGLPQYRAPHHQGAVHEAARPRHPTHSGLASRA